MNISGMGGNKLFVLKKISRQYIQNDIGGKMQSIYLIDDPLRKAKRGGKCSINTQKLLSQVYNVLCYFSRTLILWSSRERKKNLKIYQGEKNLTKCFWKFFFPISWFQP